MMRYHSIPSYLPVALICGLLFTFSSCKKETAYDQSALSGIVSYAVTADGKSIEASLKGDSLVIYWPWPVAVPATITPQITTSGGASISPASGIEVSFVTGTAYTLKGANGSQKTYYLKIVKNWPDLESTKSTSDNEAVLGANDVFVFDNLKYVLPEISQTKFYLVSRKTGVETALPVTAVTTSSITVKIPVNVPTDSDYGNATDGSWVKIENAGRTLRPNYVIYVF